MGVHRLAGLNMGDRTGITAAALDLIGQSMGDQNMGGRAIEGVWPDTRQGIRLDTPPSIANDAPVVKDASASPSFER